MQTELTRRELLRYSLAGGVAVWAGAGPRRVAELFRVQRVNPERFPQSVASGDPRPDGIVLWTRVAPPRGGGTVRVAYEVAAEDDAEFARPVLRGMAETSAG